MQRQLRLGFFVTAALGLSACSSEAPDERRFLPAMDPTASAGSGGAAGAGGGGSSAGAGGGSSGGSAGAQGPTTFPPPPCTGCVEMDVPLPANSAAIAMYNFVFPNTGVDMSNATVTWSISTLTPGADVYVTPFAQNGMDLAYAGVYRPQTLLTEANGFTSTGSPFVNVVFDLANTAPFGGAAAAQDAGGADAGDAGPAAGGLLDNGGLDKSRVVQLGIQIGSLATLATPTTVRLLVDKIDFEGVDPNDPALRDRDFSDGPQDLMQNTYMLPAGSTGPTKY